MKNDFVISFIQTAMDILVFVLCVDKGLSPVTIVGACYIALRLFSYDAQCAINESDDWCDQVAYKFKTWNNKRREEKEKEKAASVDAETEMIDG